MPAVPPLDSAMGEVLGHLSVFVPAAGGGLPDNSVRLTTARSRALGIGHRRGSDYRVGLPAAALTGVRVDATARFELWGDDPVAADGLMEGLHASLLGAFPSLRALGFLKLEVAASAPAERIETLAAWRKTSDFALLYEFRSTSDDGADSYLVRVPLRSDLEEPGSPEGSVEVVTGVMRRWDEEGAPPLVLRGGRRDGRPILGLATLDFRPGGFLGAGVVVERLDTALAAAPTDYATLDDFLAAVTDPAAPDTHARVAFATLDDFLAALDPAGAPVLLGDWNLDAVADEYLPRQRLFDAPLLLPSGRDLFAVRYQAAAFASTAVFYLRVNPTSTG